MAEVIQEHGAQDAESTEPAANPAYLQVRDHWHWVRPGIEEILAEQPLLTFRPEDVYALCLEGKAHLWGAPEGFVVSTTQVDQFSGKKTFFVWLAWARERGNHCVIKYLPFFTAVAREHGYNEIEVRTPHPKLEKYLVDEGWQKETVIFKRAV